MMNKNIAISLLLSALPLFVLAQNRTKSTFVEYKPGYFENSVLKDNRTVEQLNNPPQSHKSFRADLDGIVFPNKISFYNQIGFSFPPISQGNTGTCWCFSTTSFYESEVYRLTGQKIRISEIFTVYWEYVEKARRFVKERGNSLVDQGSEANAAT